MQQQHLPTQPACSSIHLVQIRERFYMPYTREREVGEIKRGGRDRELFGLWHAMHAQIPSLIGPLAKWWPLT